MYSLFSLSHFSLQHAIQARSSLPGTGFLQLELAKYFYVGLRESDEP